MALICDQYIRNYRANVKTGHTFTDPFAPGEVARNVDLFSIGDGLLDKGRATFMFVFEGSLAATHMQSVNALSCLWSLRCFDVDAERIQSRKISDMAPEFQAIARVFWPPDGKRFIAVMNSLRVTPDVARCAFVVDAVRVPHREGNRKGKPDRRANQRLLKSEVELLNPCVIIGVGNVAKDYLKRSIPEGFDGHVVTVPFHTNFISNDKRASVEQSWEGLLNTYAEPDCS